MSTSRSCKKRSCQSSRPSGSRGISKWFSRCLCTSWGRSPQKYVSFMWVWVNTYRYIFNGMNIHKSQLFWGFTRGTRVLTHSFMCPFRARLEGEGFFSAGSWSELRNAFCGARGHRDRRAGVAYNLFGMKYFYLRTGSMFRMFDGWKESWFALWCPTRWKPASVISTKKSIHWEQPIQVPPKHLEGQSPSLSCC